ncbi:MAG: hypothetical protein ACRDO4_03695 [Nocardioides sp.]
MAEKDPGNDGPSLELPSFFRRKKKPAVAEPAPAEPPEPQGSRHAQPPSPTVQPDPTAAEPVDTTEVPGARKASRAVSLPAIGGQAAAVVTGLVVGALLVGLVWGSLRLCEVVRGTSSCGQPGFLVLLAILVVLVVVGRALLKGFGVDDAGSTSFLGVGVVAVVVLLFLSGQLFEWWTALVVPAAAVASFALAQWVSTAFVETPEDNLHR